MGSICSTLYHFIVTVVGLERTFYSVSEDGGAVEVCAPIRIFNANVGCPVPFSFSISFSTSDGSAGNEECMNYTVS